MIALGVRHQRRQDIRSWDNDVQCQAPCGVDPPSDQLDWILGRSRRDCRPISNPVTFYLPPCFILRPRKFHKSLAFSAGQKVYHSLIGELEQRLSVRPMISADPAPNSYDVVLVLLFIFESDKSQSLAS